ncbi:MAG: flagellar hook-length control protein FliK, partial [Spirochaetales bacterium]|nr:flagellar hook-length control protein FliK [Spirochaetales bacterium]
MLPVQMPLQRVDNSFDSNDSKMVRSVETDNLQSKGKFNEVFETASSEYKKMKKSDVEEKLKPAVEKNEDSEKQLKHKNEKLISLRKVGTDNLKAGLKKSKNSESPEENISGILDKSETVKVESNIAEELLSDNYSETIVINPEAVDKSIESSIIPNDANFSRENSETVVSVDLKDSVLLKTVSDEKKNSSGKKNTVKKGSKITKAKISVLDLRQTDIKNSRVKQTELNAEREGSKFSVVSSEQLNSDNNQESKPIVIELTHVKDNFSSESKTLTTASSSALMKQLEENVNSKIVKQSSVILKDGGSGEIKLILKPEQLGSVRIRLSLTDNRIAGQIIVDSSAVKEIFEQNLQNLERAFKENG